MEKKIICILVSMLMFATAFSVAGTMNQNTNDNLVSTGLTENQTPISNIESTAMSLPFYVVNDETDYFCSFDPSSPGTYTNIGPATPTGFIQNACFVEDVYWVVDQYGNLYTVDLTTGVFTTIGAAGVTDAMGLAYDDTTGNMYMTAGSTNPGNLYEIDMGTGHATLIGNMGNTGFAMISLVCDNDGQLYGVEITSASTPGQFYSIDKTTGAATPIGSGVGFNMNYGQDMEYDKDNDILYFCAYNYNAGPEFRTIDKTTGTSTLIGSLPGQSTGFAIPYILNYPPLTPDAPDGPDEGIIGVDYTFTATTTDPEGDPIEYWFDWDDGTNSGWVSPGNAQHAWTAAGSYDVKVKARDTVSFRESEFSPAHIINIVSGPIIKITAIKSGLFKIKAVINNTGATDATDVEWSINLNGGAWIGAATSGTIPSIPAGQGVEVSSKLILGLGKTSVTVEASVPESSDSQTRNGNILFFIIIVNVGG